MFKIMVGNHILNEDNRQEVTSEPNLKEVKDEPCGLAVGKCGLGRGTVSATGPEQQCAWHGQQNCKKAIMARELCIKGST